MGFGEAVFYGVLTIALAGISAAAVVVWVRRWWKRRNVRTLSDTIAEQIAEMPTSNLDPVNGAPVIGVPLHVWNLAGRHATAGDTRPDHDPDDEDCWCRPCYDAELTRLQDAEIGELFAGLVDTPELRDLADRAERGLR